MLLSNRFRILQKVPNVWRNVLPLGGLTVLTFHNLVANETERQQTDPRYTHTIEEVEAILLYLLRAGFAFVSMEQVLGGLPTHGRLALLTMDDGYAGNLALLPILDRLGIPVTWFITTAPIASGQPFWWDAFAAAHPEKTRSAQKAAIQHLAESGYPASAKNPSGQTTVPDFLRPLTPEELCQACASGAVSIGFHGHTHTWFTRLNADQRRAECQASATLFHEWGLRPLPILAFPDGAFNRDAVLQLQQDGFDAVFTTRAYTNPPTTHGIWGRFTLYGDEAATQVHRIVHPSRVREAWIRRKSNI